ncbi:hypothetical protein GO755_40410 [Spirosoma sp. HMF4905]|uniref:Uncharacterized protein n=1 Tax=Spirosoma arboris TaxID=2682092 RepID=A0A7K1SRY6_9BACT|nr:hypothetical protein [Spirosoma arboris]MVM36336.1 hypothetical protein [Spirosoma arboris]
MTARQNSRITDTFSEDDDDLPFGPSPGSNKTLLSFEVAKEVRAAGFSIWLIQKFDYGLLFRCSAHGRQIRVILPTMTQTIGDPVYESNSRLHIATSIAGLRSFLTMQS